MNPTHVAVSSDQIPFVAVGICRTSYGNLHTGVVYRGEDEKFRLFHQAWHHQTCDEPLQEGSERMGGPFLCIVPNIPKERAIVIAEFWSFVASLKQPIGYALKDDVDARFDPFTGVLTLPNGIGLSCSTFVLVMFRSARWPYLDTTDWPKVRSDDTKFQAELVNLLDKTCFDKKHVEAVKEEVGCARIRPEEAADVALYQNLPVRFQEAEKAGFFVHGSVHVRGLFSPCPGMKKSD